MSSNPYSPPTSDVAIEQALPDIPEDIQNRIKGAWVAGIISGCMTLAITLLAIGGTSVLGFNAWNFVDVALISGLTFGIYRNSRTCAVLMLVYFVVSKIMIMVDGGSSSGIVMSLVFIYYFGRGVMGTFAYHKHLKS